MSIGFLGYWDSLARRRKISIIASSTPGSQSSNAAGGMPVSTAMAAIE